MAVTLKDVAMESGVSVTTVSRVLSNHPKISESTKAKVKFYAEKLGYRTNIAARSLKTKHSGLLGFVFPTLEDDTVLKVYNHIEEEVRKKGFGLIPINSKDSVEGEIEAISTLISTQVDGVLFMPCSASGAHLKALESQDIPVVTIGSRPNDYLVDTILWDDYSATYNACQELINDGITRIAYLGAKEHIPREQEKLSAYKKAMEDHGLAIDEQWIITGDYTFETGYQGMSKLMEDGIEAIYIGNGRICSGVMGYLVKNITSKSKPYLIAGEFMTNPVYKYFVDKMIVQGENTVDQAFDILQKRIAGEREGYPLQQRLSLTFA